MVLWLLVVFALWSSASARYLGYGGSAEERFLNSDDQHQGYQGYPTHSLDEAWMHENILDNFPEERALPGWPDYMDYSRGARNRGNGWLDWNIPSYEDDDRWLWGPADYWNILDIPRIKVQDAVPVPTTEMTTEPDYVRNHNTRNWLNLDIWNSHDDDDGCLWGAADYWNILDIPRIKVQNAVPVPTTEMTTEASELHTDVTSSTVSSTTDTPNILPAEEASTILPDAETVLYFATTENPIVHDNLGPQTVYKIINPRSGYDYQENLRIITEYEP